jgi:molybdopterin-guanine dinucleotide biosynthesis protein B
LEELATRFIQGVDCIIAEGFKRETYPKVEVFRKEAHPQPLAPDLENVIAVVSDDPLPLDIPCFKLNDISGIADLIEKQIVSNQ